MANKIPQALLEWLSGCPYIDSLSEDGVDVHIEQLGSEPIQFSLHATPTEAVIKRYFSGELRAKNYVLASRMEYTMDDVQRAEQSAFWDDFAAWCEVMTESKRLPDLGEGRDARSLLEERVKSFVDRLIFRSSTPTTRAGNICKSFEKSDRRYYFMPCPRCGKPIRFENRCAADKMADFVLEKVGV